MQDLHSINLIAAKRRYHHPQLPKAAVAPLSEANTTFLHNPRRSRAPFTGAAADFP